MIQSHITNREGYFSIQHLTNVRFSILIRGIIALRWFGTAEGGSEQSTSHVRYFQRSNEQHSAEQSPAVEAK